MIKTGMPEKAHEIINKCYQCLETGNRQLIAEYTLEQMRQAQIYHKDDNSKLPPLAPFLDDRIKELENIDADRKRGIEKGFDVIKKIIVIIVAGLLLNVFKIMIWGDEVRVGTVKNFINSTFGKK